jgi:hypothetical protein
MTSTFNHEAMFSLTTPPASELEFDEVEKNAIASCSPTINGFCYPSPAPSHSPQPLRALSTESLGLHDDLADMSYPDSQQPEQSYLFSSYGTSEPSFLPVSAMSEQELPPFTTSSYPPVSQQTAWLPFTTTYAQPAMANYENSASQYPPFETTMGQSYANIIPPTPQDITQATFDFNSVPRLASNGHHLSASPAFSHQSSQHSSLTSLSRSPSPTLYSMTTTSTAAPSRSTLRSNSTSSNSSLHSYGIPVADPASAPQPAWRCAYPGCTSKATFTRGCDLRKHYNRHSKHLFCRVDGCPQSQSAAASRSTDGTLSGGFSSKKDRARHEAKHNPGIKCEWTGPHGEECGRIFSRMDNMKDHVRRIHRKQEQKR